MKDSRRGQVWLSRFGLQESISLFVIPQRSMSGMLANQRPDVSQNRSGLNSHGGNPSYIEVYFEIITSFEAIVSF